MTQAAIERLGLKDEQAALNAALLGEDTLGVILRAHIHVEIKLNELIESQLAVPKMLPKLNLGFATKVKLAQALGLSEELAKLLEFVGKLRNRFAHRLGETFTAADADEFERALGPGKSVAEQAYARMKDRSSAPMDIRDPKDRMIMYFVVCWSAIAIASHKAKESRRKETPS